MRLRDIFRRTQDARDALRHLTATATPVHASPANPGPVTDPFSGAFTYARAEQPCDGCAHSTAGAPFPSFPSGERPCGFCVRNPTLPDEGVADWFGELGPLWYDGKTPPFQTPMDCYIATDRLQQQRIFDQLRHLESTGDHVPGREALGGLGNGDPIWCCEGGDGPGGHEWTCWRWLGVSFG